MGHARPDNGTTRGRCRSGRLCAVVSRRDDLAATHTGRLHRFSQSLWRSLRKRIGNFGECCRAVAGWCDDVPLGRSRDLFSPVRSCRRHAYAWKAKAWHPESVGRRFRLARLFDQGLGERFGFFGCRLFFSFESEKCHVCSLAFDVGDSLRVHLPQVVHEVAHGCVDGGLKLFFAIHGYFVRISIAGRDPV